MTDRSPCRPSGGLVETTGDAILPKLRDLYASRITQHAKRAEEPQDDSDDHDDVQDLLDLAIQWDVGVHKPKQYPYDDQRYYQ